MKIFIVFLISLITSTSFANDFQAVVDSANANFNRGSYENAIELYNKVLAADLESPELYYNLGEAYAATNKIGRAILAFERGLLLAPKDEDLKKSINKLNDARSKKVASDNKVSFENIKQDVVKSKSESSLLTLGAILCGISGVISIVGKFFRKGHFKKSFLITGLSVFGIGALVMMKGFIDQKNTLIPYEAIVLVDQESFSQGEKVLVIEQQKDTKNITVLLSDGKETQLSLSDVEAVVTYAKELE